MNVRDLISAYNDQDDATLDKFLKNPNGVVHGTSMFFSVPNATDRQNVIAYLDSLKH